MAYDFSKFKKCLQEAEEWLVAEYQGIRTGRATPAILDNISIEVYGARTPLKHVAAVSTEDAKTIRVAPWDKGQVKAIEKAIVDADLGISPAVDDQGLRIAFPELTGERRTQLTKLAGEKAEHAKVTLRSHRTDALKALDAAEKAGGMGKDEIARLKIEVQKYIDAGNDALVKVLERKETEIAQ